MSNFLNILIFKPLQLSTDTVSIKLSITVNPMPLLSSSGFDGTLFGYNFELSGLMSNWLENTDHGFFSAITLGLIQVILIVIGFVLDLVLHLLFLVGWD